LVDEREILGRGILHKLSELKVPKYFKSLDLYLGANYSNIPLHQVTSKNLNGDTIHEHFMLDSEGALNCVRNHQQDIKDYNEIEDEYPSTSSISLKEPTDFLNISYEATISLNKACN
jgi:hypothetical protein